MSMHDSLEEFEDFIITGTLVQHPAVLPSHPEADAAGEHPSGRHRAHTFVQEGRLGEALGTGVPIFACVFWRTSAEQARVCY